MPFLLDSNCFIALANGSSESLEKRVVNVALRGHPVYASSIVIFELRYGAFCSVHARRNNSRIDQVLDSRVERLEFDDEDAREAGEVGAELRRKGTPIGPYDTLIAGQARHRGLTLVTANIREFQRVSGLAVENWL